MCRSKVGRNCVKKIALSLLLFALVSGFAGCSRDTSGETQARTDQPESGESQTAGEKESVLSSENHEGENETDYSENGIKQTAQSSEDGEETGTGSESAAEAEAAPETEEPEPDWQWQHDLPENHGLDTGALESLHRILDTTDVFAMVIVRDDRIVDEYYKEGYDETSLFELHSCSKSITSALMGIAIDKEYVAGVDVPIVDYFPQIADSEDAALKQINLWHLLTHTTGFAANDTNNWEAWRGSENWVDFVLNLPVVSAPGTNFDYFTGNTHLLAAMIQEATGKTLYDFGQEYLFSPLGMDSVQCGTDAQGISDGGNGFVMNVYDMAKLGRLFLHGGVWEGKQIISEEWVRESTGLQFKRSTGSADYGYQWWVRTFGAENYDAFFAQGHFGQYIFCVPELDLIVVFTSHHTGSSEMYWDFMESIVAACEP